MSQRLAMLEKLIAQGSTDPFVHYACAMELRGLGRSSDAMLAFQRLRERFANYVPTYLMAGQLALEMAEPELARQFLEQGLAQARAAGDDHAESEISRALAGLVA
jgi:hypothetical protein